MFKLLVRCLYNCQTHTDRFVQRAPPIHRGHVRTHWRLSSVINAYILVNYAADRDPLWLTDERRDAVRSILYIYIQQRTFPTFRNRWANLWRDLTPIRPSNFFSVRYHRKCVYSRNSFFRSFYFREEKNINRKGFSIPSEILLKYYVFFLSNVKKIFFNVNRLNVEIDREIKGFFVECTKNSRQNRIFTEIHDS